MGRRKKKKREKKKKDRRITHTLVKEQAWKRRRSLERAQTESAFLFVVFSQMSFESGPLYYYYCCFYSLSLMQNERRSRARLGLYFSLLGIVFLPSPSPLFPSLLCPCIVESLIVLWSCHFLFFLLRLFCQSSFPSVLAFASSSDAEARRHSLCSLLRDRKSACRHASADPNVSLALLFVRRVAICVLCCCRLHCAAFLFALRCQEAGKNDGGYHFV